MKGVFLRLYVHEQQKHKHRLLYEWLLNEAKKLGIHGATAFRAVAGFGHHGQLHFQHFYELAGDLPMQIDFVVTDDEADRFLELVKSEGLRVFYLRLAADFGVINPNGEDAPELRGDPA